MATKEKFNAYGSLRQIHRDIFGALEDYRRQHDEFRFAVRQKDMREKLTYGLIFKGNNNYVEVGLSKEQDRLNKTRTIYLVFRISEKSISGLSICVAYSSSSTDGDSNVEKYRRVCNRIGVDFQTTDNGSRIGSSKEIASNAQGWRNLLHDWLDANYPILLREFSDLLISSEEFSELVEKQVDLGILLMDENGYSVNSQYVPMFTGLGQSGRNNGVDTQSSDDEGDDVLTVLKERKGIMSRNRILFGAPGTGKSHKLANELSGNFGERYERVTFYPTYSYAQFVGTYKPVMKAKANGEAGEEIAYEFVPGPFLRVLVKALKETPDADGKKKDWCLVIEEINRANAVAVFGDVFQLLDRDGKGESEYAIAASEDVKKYLEKELTPTGNAGTLKIPANMYIWATMNSADQGVFPIDTAFKRRWDFEYIGLDQSGENDWIIENKPYKWDDFRRYVNRLLALAKVNEDKLMGPFFVKKPINGIVGKNEFESKVLMYLWEDAGKMCRRQLFDEIVTYSELIDAWNEKGIEIFSPALREKDRGNKLKSANALYWKLIQNTTDQGGN